MRPDLVFENIRGNVDTRVRKVLDGEADGAVLAMAGLRRLGLEDKVAETLDQSIMIPAPGQGIIAVEGRVDDADSLALAAATDDEETHTVARAERAFVRALGGGCDTPLGVYASLSDGRLYLQGVLASPDGSRLIRKNLYGVPQSPEEAGAGLARRILGAGGADLIGESGGSGREEAD